jgi:hypothetical protein
MKWKRCGNYTIAPLNWMDCEKRPKISVGPGEELNRGLFKQEFYPFHHDIRCKES